MGVTPAYIAGPFAGDTAENTRRAVALCRWAVAQGYAPECIHATIAAGGYGDDDDDPADRERGLLACEARVAMTARAGGALLVILRDDGTTSAGTTREVEAYRLAGGRELVSMTWAGWVGEWGVSP